MASQFGVPCLRGTAFTRQGPQVRTLHCPPQSPVFQALTRPCHLHGYGANPSQSASHRTIPQSGGTLAPHYRIPAHCLNGGMMVVPMTVADLIALLQTFPQ